MRPDHHKDGESAGAQWRPREVPTASWQRWRDDNDDDQLWNDNQRWNDNDNDNGGGGGCNYGGDSKHNNGSNGKYDKGGDGGECDNSSSGSELSHDHKPNDRTTGIWQRQRQRWQQGGMTTNTPPQYIPR